ncbi:MAG: transketolase [Burkholderiales bacterium]|nr:transketolase [Burkholderiales bacterium]
MDSSVSTKTMANAIRALTMDSVQKAKSGHPGMPMGMADIATALWKDHLRHNPNNPQWIGRDRFLLSNGHGSMLQYALLHLSGYDVSLEDLKNFRQLHSKTPGHPEVGVTPGVETTTGPLGQGIANAVGFALAEKMLASEFNREGYDIIDNYTYAFLGDGCLMEGISHEACSLAGVWKLNKLIALYDDNGISIDGKIQYWFADDTRKRFESYGWNVIGPIDGHDFQAISNAIAQAKKSDKPTIIDCRTVIGFGSPNKQGTNKVHGEALGDAEIAITRDAIGWKYGPFEIPAQVYEAWDSRAAGDMVENAWNQLFESYSKAYPDLAAELTRRLKGDLPANWDDVVMEAVVKAATDEESMATRKASQMALNEYAPHLPELVGGSADLTSSNLTAWKDVKPLRADDMLGRHINYGVREFAMAAIMNGIALYGGFIPYGATFLTFSDYEKNALRMAALMKLRTIFVFTHDSIGVGEDGPTHQPIEQISSLRLIPNMDVWRPADTVETLVAWASAIERKDGPSSLIFSRQNLPYVYREEINADDIAKGGYVLQEAPEGPDTAQVTLLATGSEVPLAAEARKLLIAENIKARLVSMPSTTVFDRQPHSYRRSVLRDAPIIAIEAGSTGLWWKYVKGNGTVIGIDEFGASAPAAELFKLYGFTPEKVVEVVKNKISSNNPLYKGE